MRATRRRAPATTRRRTTAARPRQTQVRSPKETTLDQLAQQIKEALQHAERKIHATLEDTRRAGELLIKAKEEVEHGEWGLWLEKHFALSESSAGLYMKLAREWDKIPNVGNLSLREAAKLLYAPDKKPSAGEDGAQESEPPPWTVQQVLKAFDRFKVALTKASEYADASVEVRQFRDMIDSEWQQVSKAYDVGREAMG